MGGTRRIKNIYNQYIGKSIYIFTGNILQ